MDALCRLDEPDAGAESVAPPFIDTDLYLRRRQGGEDDRQAADGQARRERTALAHWWVRRMVAADIPLREKLTFHWHDHFATGDKVRSAGLHARQRDLLHTLGAGRFPVLVEAVARDPAMLVWLDGRLNVVGRPNENFAPRVARAVRPRARRRAGRRPLARHGTRLRRGRRGRGRPGAHRLARRRGHRDEHPGRGPPRPRDQDGARPHRRPRAGGGRGGRDCAPRLRTPRRRRALEPPRPARAPGRPGGRRARRPVRRRRTATSLP